MAHGSGATNDWGFVPGVRRATAYRRRRVLKVFKEAAPGTLSSRGTASAERSCTKSYWQVAATILTDSAFSLGAVTVEDALD